MNWLVQIATNMYIYDLFKIIRDAEPSEDDFYTKRELNDTVRSILEIRSRIDLGVDVIDLHERMEDVVDYLADENMDISGQINAIFAIPEVQEYVHRGEREDVDEDGVVERHVSPFAIAIPFGFLVIAVMFNILATLNIYDACARLL